MKKSTYRLRSISIATLTAVAGVVCKGAVAWTGTAAELRVVAGQEKTVAEFAFHNSGARLLRFTSLRPGCDCLTAQANKESYAPGEAGFVRAEIALAGLFGRVERRLTVTTDDPTEKPVELLLIVEIPELVSIRPRTLSWDAAAPGETKSLSITVAQPARAAVTDVRCDDARFIPTLTSGPKAGTYAVTVQTTDTTTPIRTTMRVTTVIDGKPSVSVVYLAVK